MSIRESNSIRVLSQGNSYGDRSKNALETKILSQFNNSNPSYFVVTRQGISIDSIITDNTSSARSEKLDDSKSIILKPGDILSVGDVFTYLSEEWICIKSEKFNDIYYKGNIQKSNNILSYYSNKSPFLCEIPCIIGDKVTLSTNETKYVTTVSNEMYLTVPNTNTTRQIKPSEIYRIGLHSYSISTVGDDVSAPGLIIFKVVYSEVEQAIPTHSYGITILNGTNASISQGETLQLNVEVIDNSQVLSPTPTITYISSDPTICSVDSNGLVTAINSGGNCTITATYEGVSDSIAISVSTVVTHNYTVDIIPSGTLKVGQTITATAQFKDNGVVTSDTATSWWVLADDDISSTNLVTLTYDGNTATIKANSTTGYVMLHVGGYNCQGSIRLQIKSLF